MSPDVWWTISDVALLAVLRRVGNGEDPDLVYAEMYANGDALSAQKRALGIPEELT